MTNSPKCRAFIAAVGYFTIATALSACKSSMQNTDGASSLASQRTTKHVIAGTRDQGSAGKNLTEDKNDGRTCNDHNQLRNAYFGDLHIHTALSLDAYQQDVRTMPKDAYDFARGKEIPFHGTVARINRPLDFAAVTDHSEYLGDLGRCTSNDDPMYDTEVCDTVRRGAGAAFQVLETAFEAETKGTRAERVMRAVKILLESEAPKRNTDLCGEQGKLCAKAEQNGWQKIIDAAEHAQDRSAKCEFTTFIGYEYSGIRTGSNYHRNVIFRNTNVPVSPVSYLDAPKDYMLWQRLNHACIENIVGCDYLAIPHNSNLSNGKLLTPDYSAAENPSEEKTLALLRQKSEPLMEIFQHKGQSECMNDSSDIDAERDELCEFEQVRNIGDSTVILEAEVVTEGCGDGTGDGGMMDIGCVSRNDYLRGALLTGLSERQRLGVNPLKLGVIASTDTHESTPGAVDEQTWQGHVGREASLPQRLQKKTGLPYRLDGNPGGLAGVWAVENSRDAIFTALKRRETFGTSGPRIQPRLFGGWSYDLNLCDEPEFLKRAYEGGVPMGADLLNSPEPDAKPRFAAVAERDPEGNLLQRLQIIKGWVDTEGTANIEVTDIAGDPDNGADVDLASGEISGPGFNSLCTVFVDEKFKPEEPAYYYLRVVENPSLRWNWAQCIALVDDHRPEECQNDAPKSIQERAWSSPIWYTPTSGDAI